MVFPHKLCVYSFHSKPFNPELSWIFKATVLVQLHPSQFTSPELETYDTDQNTMLLQFVPLSVVLLAWSPTALSLKDVSLGDIVRNLTADASGATSCMVEHQEIRSGLERLQHQLTALQDQLTAAQSAAADECPSGWSRHNSSCYLIPAVTATWFGASVLCPTMDRRARLTSVHLDNHQFVEQFVEASGAHEVWAGGVRLRLGGIDWGWQDGTPFDYANWAPGPSAGNNNEDCIIMRGPKSGYNAKVGQWHDGLCCHPGSNFNFLCQITL